MDVAALQIVVANERPQTEKELIKRLKLKDIGLKVAFEHAAKSAIEAAKSAIEAKRFDDRWRQAEQQVEFEMERSEGFLKEIVARDKALNSMQEVMNMLHKMIERLEKEKATIKRSTTRQINTLRKKLGMPKKDNKTKKTK